MRSRRLLIVLAALPILAVFAIFGYREYGPAGSLAAPLPPPREPALPDLTMPRLADVRAEFDKTGRDYISFTAAIANIGSGPLLVHAERPARSDEWRVTQRFDEPDGQTERVTPGSVVWGGHGHNHWHVKLGASYLLSQTGRSTPERRLQKQGFCFFDQVRLKMTLPRAASLPAFDKSACDGRNRRDFDMGLSVGWFDPYFWFYADQRIDVTGLPPGKYRLTANADPDGWFLEENETNNDVWADVTLGRRPDGAVTIEVVRNAPNALAIR